LRHKIVLCSPLTLYAVLAVIRQSVDNFRLERDPQFTQLGHARKRAFELPACIFRRRGRLLLFAVQ